MCYWLEADTQWLKAEQTESETFTACQYFDKFILLKIYISASFDFWRSWEKLQLTHYKESKMNPVMHEYETELTYKIEDVQHKFICTKTSNRFPILCRHSGPPENHFTGIPECYSRGHAIQRITCFLCDSSLYFSSSSLHSAGVSCHVLARHAAVS